MPIDDSNTTANYSRHLTRDICSTIREMSDDQKQRLLDEIQLRKGVHALTEQPFNHNTCNYIESLLNGKRPKNKIA